MYAADRMLELAEIAFHACPADEVEVVCATDDLALTRFANSQIHQNVSSETIELRVRAVAGRRVGFASTTRTDADGLRQVAAQAAAAARLAAETPDFAGLPAPTSGMATPGYVAATAACAPERRADIVGTVCRSALTHGLVAAGACQTRAHALAIVNSHGVRVHGQGTSADLHTVIMTDDAAASGYAAHASTDVGALDADRIADEAVERALRSRDAGDLAEGDYEVVLAPYATADVVEMLAYLGFGALAYEEGTSFLRGRIGTQIADAAVSIWDDALDPSGLPFPFDYEGVAKQHVQLIERGIGRGVVHDTQTAARAGVSSTGHALAAPNTFGPLPLNLFMAGGQAASLDALVAQVARGVLITRFWYTRPVHPLRTLITGMTRDGTFLIEDGRVVRAVRNTRYTQSYLEALSEVRGATAQTTLLAGDMFGAQRVPALHLGQWRFHGAS